MGMGVRREPADRVWFTRQGPFGKDNRKARRMERARRKSELKKQIRDQG